MYKRGYKENIKILLRPRAKQVAGGDKGGYFAGFMERSFSELP